MITYKIDILKALKEKGYSQYRLQKEKLLPGKTLNHLKNSSEANINISTLNIICELLEMQPGELIEHIPENIK